MNGPAGGKGRWNARLIWNSVVLYCKEISSVALSLISAAAFLLVVVVLFLEAIRPSIIIEPISVPKTLTDNGYDSTVTALKLRDAIDNAEISGRTTMLKILSRRKQERVAVFGSEEQFKIEQIENKGERSDRPDFVVPSVGLSAASIVATISAFLHISKRDISGEVISSQGHLSLTLRLNGEKFLEKVRRLSPDNPDPLLNDGARAVLQKLQPAPWYLLRGLTSEQAGQNAAALNRGPDVAQDYITAIYYYKLAAAQGSVAGKGYLVAREVYLGAMYYFGHFVSRDYAIAVHYYKLAAAQGDALGENNLGFMYDNGYGVRQDYVTAVHYFEIAARQGDANGESNLGSMFREGYGVRRDYTTAVHYYQLAAAQGDSNGEVNLGFMYARGYGVRKDFATSVRYYRLAAEQGNALGENNLGYTYELGRGVVQNYTIALLYYRLAAAQGNDEGENDLGTMYEKGRSVAQSYAIALHYYQLAAAQDNAEGESNLGAMYEKGRGVAQNYAIALHYYRLAAAQGNVDAVAALARPTFLKHLAEFSKR